MGDGSILLGWASSEASTRCGGTVARKALVSSPFIGIDVRSRSRQGTGVCEGQARPHIVHRADPHSRAMVAVIPRVASRQDVIDGLRALTAADLRRLERIARTRTIGLPEIEWQDLLQEAIVRTLDGTRKWPKQLSLVVFLRETMRSIASDYWRRRKITPVVAESQFPNSLPIGERTFLDTVMDPTADPERDAAASETLARIDKAFADDLEALHVLSGMALGKSPWEIQEEGNIDTRRYASIQRRIRRTLAKEFPDRGGI